MKCKKCDKQMTPLTTVIPLDTGKEEKKKMVRRGMVNWRTCYDCDRIIRSEV